MHIRPIVQKPRHSHSSSMAVASAGLFAFAVLVSGLWHPKFSHGGVTQVGREASITFDDGSVLTLTEPESDLDILRRRRMAGWGGHEYRQIFIKSDGTEMEVGNDQSRDSDDADLDTGDHLMLASYRKRAAQATAPLDAKDGVIVANLQVDPKDKVATADTDPKDRVVTDVIDSKDVTFVDNKDVVEQPVFALSTTSNPYGDEGVIGALIGYPGSMWGDIRTASSTGLLNGGTGGSTTGGGGSGGTTPIGVAVPEPSTWALVWVMGAVGLAVGIRRSRRLAR